MLVSVCGALSDVEEETDALSSRENSLRVVLFISWERLEQSSAIWKIQSEAKELLILYNLYLIFLK